MSEQPAEGDNVRALESERLLLQYLHERDVQCPRCGYNLRNLTQPVCPECREPLALKVGVQRLALAPLLVALAPGGFCAVAVGIFIVMSAIFGPPSMTRDAEVWLTMAFIAVSAAVAIVLACTNRWFMRLNTSTQIGMAAVIWVVHIGVFAYIVSHM
ncbi:MAG TPA: hypothetical protein VMS30_01670 [Phycisphaerales bacterium]|nr:hypothetical protein [Phycisphaerales bacterium]